MKVKTWAEKAREQFAHIPILPLEELSKLPQAEEYDAGIYFLWDGPALVYIGKSTHICERMMRQQRINQNHVFYTGRHRVIPHDRHTALVLEKGMFISPELRPKLMVYERAYIAHYLPAFNHPDDNGGT